MITSRCHLKFVFNLFYENHIPLVSDLCIYFRELLRLRLRPAESRRRKERTEPRRSVELPRPRLEQARSKPQH